CSGSAPRQFGSDLSKTHERVWQSLPVLDFLRRISRSLLRIFLSTERSDYSPVESMTSDHRVAASNSAGCMLNLNDLRKLRFSNKKWFAISLPLLRFKCWRISAFRLLLSRSTLCFRRIPGSSKTRDVRKVWASGRMTNVKVTILWAVLGITGLSIASE